MPGKPYDPEIIDLVCEQLEAGASLRSICAQDGMPSRQTVWRWSKGDDETAQRIRDAWELGFLTEGERIYEAVLACEDPHKGKTMLEAAKWHLGHRSMAYANKPSVVGVTVNVDAERTFDAIAGLLEQASAGLSSCRQSTYIVAGDGKARPINSRGGLPHMAADGGERVRKDEDG